MCSAAAHVAYTAIYCIYVCASPASMWRKALRGLVVRVRFMPRTFDSCLMLDYVRVINFLLIIIMSICLLYINSFLRNVIHPYLMEGFR